MHIHLLQAITKRKLRSSKDTNGGYGTVNDFGRGLVPGFLKYYKSRSMNYPELLPAYVHAIVTDQGHRFTYAENELHPAADIVLIQTSIVDYALELNWAERIRWEYPQTRVGFLGGMAAGNPHLYGSFGDFVLAGEAESLLWTGRIDEFSGIVTGEPVENLDDLPFPNWTHLQSWRRRYGFLRRQHGRFFPIQSSRGCPMPCAYYCTYPLTQGAKFRARSPENVVEELVYLQERYDMHTVMFRDPIFTLQQGRVARFCELLLQRDIRLSWVCETHPRFLTPDLVGLMARAGCVAVKLGIESGDAEVMDKSKRAGVDLKAQERTVRCLEEQGIDVLAFYILGYFDDTPDSTIRTIEYAKRLNTFGAQFSIATPYPGTAWYDALHRDGSNADLDSDFERYTQYHLVYNHPHLSDTELEQFKSFAYRSYYLRWAYFRKHFYKS